MFDYLLRNIVDETPLRLANPINFFIKYTRYAYPLGECQNATDKAARGMRSFLRKILEEKAEEIKKNPNKEEDGIDFLDHLLKKNDAFKNMNEVLDAVCDLFGAAVLTT